MFLQLVFNSLISGLLLALVAVGFNLIFNTTKVFHLAHGAIYVCGAYALLWFLKLSHLAVSPLQWLIPLLLTLSVVILLSLLIELLVYRPLAQKGSSQAITLISSMAVYIFIINSVVLLFGNESKFIQSSLINSVALPGLITTPIQLIQLGVSISLLGGLLLAIKSKWFLQVKAVMSNEIVASVMGVNSKNIRILAMTIGGVLAAVSAILKTYDSGINPNAGIGITLSATVAVIIGGSTSIGGTILASLFIASLQTTTEWYFSAQWKEGITFLLLILVLLWRTEGIVSFKMRVEEK